VCALFLPVGTFIYWQAWVFIVALYDFFQRLRGPFLSQRSNPDGTPQAGRAGPVEILYKEYELKVRFRLIPYPWKIPANQVRCPRFV
jgi:hypothetical protein